jgi:hypothetical protein
MTDTTIDQEAEALLRAASSLLTDPHEGECLLCFVARMLDDFGCDTTLRWAARYRDVRAPRARALEQRLGSVGGFCDCEIFLNGYQLAEALCDHDEWGDRVAPAARPTCTGARGGSTKPCSAWQRQRRRG